MLNVYNGRSDLEMNGYGNSAVYRAVNKEIKFYKGYVWRRFPKKYKPEIGKQYDTEDPIFDRALKKKNKKRNKNKKKEYQMAFKF